MITLFFIMLYSILSESLLIIFIFHFQFIALSLKQFFFHTNFILLFFCFLFHIYLGGFGGAESGCCDRGGFDEATEDFEVPIFNLSNCYENNDLYDNT